MAAKQNTLTAQEIDNAISGGKSIRKLHDRAGLCLWMYFDSRKYWRLRYWMAGKEKSLSVGAYPETGLKEAWQSRDDNRKLLGNPAARSRGMTRPGRICSPRSRLTDTMGGIS